MEEKRKPAEWQEMLLQYRLNELDETEREEIDTRLITDEEFAEAMQGAEYDLLDAYAANELSSRDRQRVEQALQPKGRFSPEAPGRVIAPVSEPTARPSVVDATPVAPKTHRRAKSWVPVLALAATAVFLAAGLTVDHWRTHSSESSVPAPQAESRQPSSLPMSAPPGAEIETKPPTPAAVKSLASIATLVLPPALRSAASLHLPIAAGVRTVRFVWPLDSPSPGAHYEMQVVSEDGAVNCRSRGMPSSRRGSAISFTCPADSLPSGPSFVRVLAQGAMPDDPPLIEVAVTVTKAQ